MRGGAPQLGHLFQVSGSSRTRCSEWPKAPTQAAAAARIRALVSIRMEAAMPTSPFPFLSALHLASSSKWATLIVSWPVCFGLNFSDEFFIPGREQRAFLYAWPRQRKRLCIHEQHTVFTPEVEHHSPNWRSLTTETIMEMMFPGVVKGPVGGFA